MPNPSVPVVVDADTLCKHFRHVFAKPQYAHFYCLVVSLLISLGAHRVTDAVRLFQFRRHWTNVYAFLRSKAWSHIAVLQALWSLVWNEMGNPSRLFVILDDTTIRHAGAKKIPAVRAHFNASAQNDPCRPRTIWGHRWVILGLAVGLTTLNWECLPLCAELMEEGVSRFEMALYMLVSLQIPSSALLTVIADGWWTRRSFLLSLRQRKMHYIGKVRRDARVYELPTPPRKPRRGRPATKGARVYLPDLEKAGPELLGVEVIIRGIKRSVDVRSRTLMLEGGLRIKAVVARWRLKNGRERWLYLLCTDLELATLEILRHYDARWMIEPCFCDLKQKGGLASYGGRTVRAHRAWAQICCVARALLVLLNLKRPFTGTDPWRRSTQPDHITTGQRRAELALNFEHFLRLAPDAHNSSDSGLSKCQRSNFR
jgi:hypothetical protein